MRDFRWWLDLQPRFFDATDGLGQALVRPGGSGTPSRIAPPDGRAMPGSSPTARGGSQSREHRIWQQLTWSPATQGFGLSSRTRLEQRFLDTGSDVGWRFRQFVQGTFPPVAAEPRLFLTAYDEIFVDRNGTDWGQCTGLSQNRFSLSLGWKLGAAADPGPFSLEIGYHRRCPG